MINPLAAATNDVPDAVPAASSSTVTLGAVLGGLRWEEAMRLVIESDPYYSYRSMDEPVSALQHSSSPSSSSPTATSPAASAAAAASPQSSSSSSWGSTLGSIWQRLRRYVLCSSKTRLLVHAGALSYFVYVVTHPSRHVPCIITIDGAVRSSVVSGLPAAPSVTSDTVLSAPRPPSSTTCYVYESAEGMQLLMHAKMPKWVVFFHAVAGILLLPLAIAQKESVWYMSLRGPTPAPLHEGASASLASPTESPPLQHQHRRDAKRALLRSARAARWWHGVFGLGTLVCVGCMVGGGVSLRSYSVFSATEASRRAGVMNFSSAMLLFAAPWLLLAPATGLTGQKSLSAAHTLLGGLIVKAVLAVPFERMLGGLCQRVAGVTVALPPRRWSSRRGDYGGVCLAVSQHVEAELETVYFRSVAATTVVFGVWGLVDIFRFLRLAKACANNSNNNDNITSNSNNNNTTPTTWTTAAVTAPSLSVVSPPPLHGHVSHGVAMP